MDVHEFNCSLDKIDGCLGAIQETLCSHNPLLISSHNPLLISSSTHSSTHNNLNDSVLPECQGTNSNQHPIPGSFVNPSELVDSLNQ